jgi:histidinol-phosphate aminotransferase
VPVRADASTDIDGLIAKRAPLTYLCTPNNPTGLQPTREEQTRLLNEADGIVMIDEAYGEFAGPSLAKEVVAHERSLIVRTFSKAFGLAGMRVGYGIGSRRLVREIEKARGPFLVSSVGLAAATAAITDDRTWVTAQVAAAINAREVLVSLLRERGFTPYESHGNFVFVPVRNAKQTAQRLAEQGISVRFFSGLTVIGDAVRITVAPIDAMHRVAAALAASVA